MAVVATLLVRVAANLTELDKTFSELERSADRIAKSYAKLGGQLQGIGSKLTTGLTLPIAALGIAAGKSAMDFDTALRGVQAAIQPTTAEMEQLRSAAVEWGQKTKFSATEAAQALGELGKAGVKSTDAVALLPSVLNLATVGEMDLAEAAATTTDTLGQFNLEVKDAGRVNDVLAAGAQASTTSVKELRNALVQVGSVAGNFGMTIEETTGALAAFANIGLKGEKAGTALKNVVTSIVNPMKGMKDVLLELNIGTLASADGTVHLTEVVKKLGDAGASESQIVRAFGEVAGPGMVGLVGKGTQSLVDMTTAMQNSGGTADRVAKTLLSGLGGAWEAMTGAVETASIALGTILAPALEMAAGLVSDLAEFVSGTLVPAFEALPTPLKIIAGGFVGLLAAVGPLVYVAGTLAQSWSGLVGLFAKSAGGAASAADAAKGLTTALTTQAGAAKLAAFWTGALEVVTSILVSPITAVVVAVGALVIGLRVLTGSWEGVLRVLTAGLVDFETLGRLWEGLKTVGAGVSDGFTILQSSIRDAVRTIKTEFTPAVDAMRRLVTDVGGAIRAPLAAAVRELGGATKDAASGGMDDLVQKLYDIGRAMAIESVLAQLRGQLLVVTETFRQLSIWIGNTVDSIKTLLIGAINSATGAIQIFYLQAKQLASVFGVDLPGAIQKDVVLVADDRDRRRRDRDRRVGRVEQVGRWYSDAVGHRAPSQARRGRVRRAQAIAGGDVGVLPELCPGRVTRLDDVGDRRTRGDRVRRRDGTTRARRRSRRPDAGGASTSGDVVGGRHTREGRSGQEGGGGSQEGQGGVSETRRPDERRERDREGSRVDERLCRVDRARSQAIGRWRS